MSQMIQHYQTSFVIHNEKQTGANQLFQAQRLIGEWIKSHEIRRYRDSGRDKDSSFLIDGGFHRRVHYASKCSWCDTDYCIEEDSVSWAVRYTHRDAKTRDVFWVSDIGLRSFPANSRLIVSVRISYKISTEFALTGEKFEPDVSIPWCVVGLLETFEGSRFLSGEQDVTSSLREIVTIADAEQAKRVKSYIASQDRKLAIVLLHGETQEVKREAACLSKNLFGKALVFVIPYKVDIKRVFSEYRLEFNECIFLPNFNVRNQLLAKQLRYFVTNETIASERRQIIFRSWLGVHPINERGAVSDVDNIQVLIRRRKFFKLEDLLKQCVPAEEYEKMKLELKDISGLFALSEAEKKELEEEAVQLKDRVGELEARNLDLEIEKEDLKDAHATEVFNIKAAHDAKSRKSVDNDNVLPRSYPDSFESLKQFAPFYKHLVFSERAWAPALAYRQFQDFHVVWEMLHDLDQKLWDIVFVRRGDIEREFEGVTVYEYAKGEGKQTSNDSKLAQLRKFEFEGQTYEMWTHLKYGNRPGKQLRIHFAFDHNRQRIIVGYIGEHMDNASTRNVH